MQLHPFFRQPPQCTSSVSANKICQFKMSNISFLIWLLLFEFSGRLILRCCQFCDLDLSKDKAQGGWCIVKIFNPSRYLVRYNSWITTRFPFISLVFNIKTGRETWSARENTYIQSKNNQKKCTVLSYLLSNASTKYQNVHWVHKQVILFFFF